MGESSGNSGNNANICLVHQHSASTVSSIPPPATTNIDINIYVC